MGDHCWWPAGRRERVGGRWLDRRAAGGLLVHAQRRRQVVQRVVQQPVAGPQVDPARPAAQPEHFARAPGLANQVSDYSTFGMPGLLQTRDYSLGVTVGGSRVRPDHAERVIELRMDRQRRLDPDNNPLQLLALIEESVLDRPVGGPSVMRQQLEHLIAMADRENVEIRLLPTSLGMHDGGAGPFKLLNFAQAQSIAYVEVVNGAIYVQEREQVAGYSRTVATLREIALSPADTVTAIRARLSTLT